MPTLAQKLAGLRRKIQHGESLREACAWANRHSPDATLHRLSKSTLADLYWSLPAHLLVPSAGDDFNEVPIIDFLQEKQSEQRAELGHSLSLLTDVEDTMLVQWVQQRGNMNLCPERGEIISAALNIMEKVRGEPYNGQQHRTACHATNIVSFRSHTVFHVKLCMLTQVLVPQLEGQAPGAFHPCVRQREEGATDCTN
jgi:hypothetical protein